MGDAKRARMLRLRTVLTPLLLSLAACGDGLVEEFGTPPSQLEAIGVSGDTDYDAIECSGVLTVTGSERDFTLTIADPSGDKTFDLHTPGMSDLRTLDGKTVTFSLTAGTSARSVLITDASGPLYLGQMAGGFEGVMGDDFATAGETIAQKIVRAENHATIWTWGSEVFKSDDGDVSLEPGEVGAVTRGGQLYRVTLIASYGVQHVGEEVECGETGLGAYEVLRVDTRPAALKLVRPANRGGATRSCGM